tara:strand:+ start:4716 stop:5831 length:1116 start_codon:yes stop_codon:yes gene_type:complete
MNVILFFTYNTSLKDWEESGLLSREMEHYRLLSETHNINYTFVTYGDSYDLKFDEYFRNLKIIPIYEKLKYSQNKYMKIFNSIRIKKIIKNEITSFDLIKTNQLKGSWSAIILKIFSGKPLIVRTGYDLYSFSKYEKKSKIYKVFTYLLTFLSLNFSNKYVVTSKVDQNILKKNFLFNSQKLIVQSNWVPFKTIETDINQRDKILFVGRLEKQKNIEKIFKIFNGSSFELDIFGEGSLKEILKKESLGNINFYGKIPHEQLIKKYKNYLFYISLSTHEGNSKTLLEAMAAGCVVIASDIPNNREFIVDNINGLLFDLENNDLMTLISDLLKDTEKLNKISNNAMKTIFDNYKIEKFIDRELAIYKSLNLLY